MKRIYYLLMAICLIIVACNPTVPEEPTQDPEEVKPKTEVEKVDSAYPAENYTVPSFTALCIAKEAARENPTEENLQAMYQKVDELVGKEEPYCMVANIHSDPKTMMAFNWFTNDGITDGEVQLIANANATEADFDAKAGVITVEALSTQTKALRYSGKVQYLG